MTNKWRVFTGFNIKLCIKKIKIIVSRNSCKLFNIITVSCFIFFIYASVFAQQVEISSTLNPVGSGARATGMGGAFIGVADDATAASWNPAGLIQLEKPEISAVYSYFGRKQTYSSPFHPEIATTNTMDADGLNYASIVYPFVLLNRNMVISLNYQRLFEMNKKVDFTFIPRGTTTPQDIKFEQDGFLYALSPAMAVQVTPDIYLGATLNLWNALLGDNGWVMTQNAVSATNFQTQRVDLMSCLSL